MGIQIMEMDIENWTDLDIVNESSVPISTCTVPTIAVPIHGTCATEAMPARISRWGNKYAVLNYNNTITL